MQKTFKRMNAKQVMSQSFLDSEGQRFVNIAGNEYTIMQHSRVELNNGSYTSTLVLENMDERIVLAA